MAKEVVLQSFSGEQARTIRSTIADVQARGYVDAIATGNPFESTEAFMDRFDVYSAMPGFSMVLATIDTEPVGQIFGWPLATDTTWWTGLDLDSGQPESGEFAVEDGTRTFGLSELMVDKLYTGRGIAGTLFRGLLADRHEQRVTWLVNPTNSAYAIYRHWGARRVGTLQPTWNGAPRFDVLIVDLPLSPPSGG
ncbi:GNAT family N-acetyltransferase [Nocardia panacis]|uniref:GNAT family N-acetyltransferase n=1 Tax=Nocardia panacis TaxID=2340916 RepID=A0A3A4KB27_9NOCA|nr:GNAT family N-acetyltransferase [Nocardia panacis]RJO70630.1 GNAT family N-acetyltransferase [Nocardia panacis]